MEGEPEKAPPGRSRDWTPDSGELSSHPNSRYCTPIKQCPILAPEYDDPRGVPIGVDPLRRPPKTTIPLGGGGARLGARHVHGRDASSETTAAATGAVGVVRRDPMAMLPFIGYNAADHFNHWITVGKEHDAAKLPKDLLRQLVPPRRRTAASCGLAPARTAGSSSGSSSGSRARPRRRRRRSARADAGSLDLEGVDMTREALQAALTVDPTSGAGHPADHRAVRQVRREAAHRAVDRARRPASTPRLTHHPGLRQP